MIKTPKEDAAPRVGPARRDILKALPFAGLAMCLPAVASAEPDTAPATDAKPGRDPVYQQTELIKRYYDRARF